MKSSFVFLVLLLFSYLSVGQIITNGDGSTLATKYCYADKDYEIKGQPAGGMISGCGITSQNGQWFFNPVAATTGVTVFPYQCTLSYTLNNHIYTRTILIEKPVKISPPLKEVQTCDGHFLLEAYTLYAGAYKYRWEPASFFSNPDTNITTGFINETETFVVTAIDQASNCIGTDTITVHKRPIPEVTVTPEQATILSREQVELSASGASRYQWPDAKWLNNDKIENPMAAPHHSFKYWVVGFNEYGCSDTATAIVNVNERLFVPNAFSPNGDGQNDLFRIENFGYQKIEAFKIYNRWGSLVYETVDGTRGWDGTNNGKYVEAGIYYYVIQVRLDDVEVKVFKGDLTLIR